MGKFVDLTGQVFGKLTVLYRLPNKGKRVFWLTKCICGNNKDVFRGDLQSGHVTSCGCLDRGINLTNKVFGSLLALSPTELRNNGSVMWECRCLLCNEIVYIPASELTRKVLRVNNCGNHKIEDITDSVYGYLTVIGPIKINNKTRWVCKCVCGNTTVVSKSSLTHNNTKSCGCMRSELVRKAVTKHGLCHTPEYIRSKGTRRREKQKSLDSNWNSLMELCLRKYQPVCVVCGASKDLTTDHVIPLSVGVGLYPGNAVRLCRNHNSSKGSKLLEELPVETASKISDAAESFRVAWSGGF